MKSVISWSRDSSSNLDSNSKMLQGRKTLERFFSWKLWIDRLRRAADLFRQSFGSKNLKYTKYSCVFRTSA